MLHPRPRQWRMLRSFDNKQLPAVTWITQSTASGQASEAGRAVSKRTAKTSVRPEKMSKLIFPDCRRFFYAQKLSLRPSSYRRKLFVIVFKLVRPLRSRRRSLLAQRFGGRGGLQRFPLPISIYVCFQSGSSIKKRAPLYWLISVCTHSGRHSVIRVPTPSRVITSKEALWASAIHLAMASPRPVPPSRVRALSERKKRSKI